MHCLYQLLHDLMPNMCLPCLPACMSVCLCVCALLLSLSGPVDAAYKAIDGLVRVDAELVDYSVNSVTEGIQVRLAG